MKCPKCGHEWHPKAKTVARELGARGGAKSKRVITPEQQAALQRARQRAKQNTSALPHGRGITNDNKENNHE